MGKVLLWEGRHTGSAHGMGEGGSVCLARPVLGEGVSAHGAGGHGVENRRQGGGVSGCQRRCMAAWGALLGEWGGVILQAGVCSATAFQQGLPVQVKSLCP